MVFHRTKRFYESISCGMCVLLECHNLSNERKPLTHTHANACCYRWYYMVCAPWNILQYIGNQCVYNGGRCLSPNTVHTYIQQNSHSTICIYILQLSFPYWTHKNQIYRIERHCKSRKKERRRSRGVFLCVQCFFK